MKNRTTKIRMTGKKVMPTALSGLAVCLLAGPAAQAQTASAGPVTSSSYLVTVNAAALTANSAYTLDFQLTSGDYFDGTNKTSGDGTTTISLSALTFPGIATATAASATGGATATAGGATLTDSGTNLPTAEFIQPFTATGLPGQTVTFDLILNSVASQLKSPDEFSFGIFNSAGAPALPTADSFGGVLINLTLPTSQPKTASVLTNDNTGLITIVAAPVPEASTTVSLGLLLALGLGGLAVSAQRRKRSASR